MTRQILLAGVLVTLVLSGFGAATDSDSRAQLEANFSRAPWRQLSGEPPRMCMTFTVTGHETLRLASTVPFLISDEHGHVTYEPTAPATGLLLSRGEAHTACWYGQSNEAFSDALEHGPRHAALAAAEIAGPGRYTASWAYRTPDNSLYYLDIALELTEIEAQ